MAEAKTKTADTKTIGLGIRLVPSGDSDQPVVANYSALTLAPGMGFLDFGFLEPAMLAALPRVAKEGGKLPESINGRLAVRVALSYETLANLQQQLTKALAGLQAAAKRGGEAKA
jgi:hypothetical protein